MAATPDRPPSERGVEFQTLDAIAELKHQVEDLAQQRIYVPQGNWWDVLGAPPFTTGGGRVPSWLAVFAQRVTEMYLPPLTSHYQPSLRVQVMPAGDA